MDLNEHEHNIQPNIQSNLVSQPSRFDQSFFSKSLKPINQNELVRSYNPFRNPMDFVKERVEVWTKELKSVFNNISFEIGTGGSIASGHFDGIKRSSHSTNPHCPYEWVIEWDGRIYVPDHVNIHDFSENGLVRKIEEATGLKWDGDLGQPGSTGPSCYRWGKQVPLVRFFGYEQIDPNFGQKSNTAFEYEICLLHKSTWLEITHYWPYIFTSKEVEWQKQVRAQLRNRHADYIDVVEPLKQLQCNEAVWRIVSLYALAIWLKENNSLAVKVNLPTWQSREQKLKNNTLAYLEEIMPLPTDNPPLLIQPFVEAWLSGAESINVGQGDVTTGLLKPQESLAAKQIECLLAHDTNLLFEPKEPQWVKFAEKLQRLLKINKKLTVH